MQIDDELGDGEWDAAAVEALRDALVSLLDEVPGVPTWHARRIATSVWPEPTSPHTIRSIGWFEAMSSSTFWIASAWSAVSSKGNALAKAW